MFRNNTIRKAAGVSGLFAAVMLTAPSAMAAPIHRADDEVRLPIRAQAQERDQWCWSATGTTIANYKGISVSQNEFCNLAFGRPRTSECPNQQATLENDQKAFRALGVPPGQVSSRPVSYTGVQKDINADRPILTRIGWKAGGGHMMVISGFSASDQSIEWYDPWPSNKRMNVGKYDFYVNNHEFAWTHSLSQIGG
ncbi:papain-like cysteine protease family protein [Dermatophilus congolensis]|uniref:papain-like cysteine protease family protein n=1 Tax=Dermatophilus congolensis TaxID=1863 RepID=UPI001AAE9D27|nr:papain-like cysteine protease family protein [Dermatophilus congolensis]MBO3143541.1 hypothetical protein [Dermatophilus congolensis]MBO3152532.1 hypothetical protein [Dermatophilus congolensis]MBO3160457.1 hypothetical protein [Dermatophilus congolensis]MBO3163818.1 hypothetical protein [Dermatophilus congolensis]MBO3177364.1 hypothetical protein [Dermatophilus congolensis]